MAEQPRSTETKPTDPVEATGVGLRASEWKRLEKIANELGETKHAVATYAIRDFMRRYEMGEIETQTRKTLPGL